MSGLKIIAGPSVTPVSRTEARNHLSLDEDIDDSGDFSEEDTGPVATLCKGLLVRHRRNHSTYENVDRPHASSSSAIFSIYTFQLVLCRGGNAE